MRRVRATLRSQRHWPSSTGLLRCLQRASTGAFLSQIVVEGFRGVGPEQTLSIVPGPGLTLIVGRNGSGKSSFAEGLETLLTGASQRWLNRAKEWKDGWKNLHTADAAFVAATFTAEGSDAIVLRRIWKAGAALDESELRVTRGAERLEGLGTLGWQDALTAFRPFLCYAELGALLNRPSELYDSLKGILGLEELVIATKRLTVERKARDERSKRGKDECKRLMTKLELLPDEPRAVACHAAMKGRVPKLEQVETIVLGARDEGDEAILSALRALAQLSAPSIDAVATAAAELRGAVAALAELAGTSADQSARLADVLEKALHSCGDSAAECPVCGGALAGDWSQRARARLAETRDLTSKVRAATNLRDVQLAKLRGLIRPPPVALDRADALGLPTALAEAWHAWSSVPGDSLALCAHAEAKVLELHAAFEPFVRQAREKLERLESAWRPVALELATWLETARAAERDVPVLKALTAAEDWLKRADSELRDARFAPIAARAQTIWNDLRQQSNVDIAQIKLEGQGTKRRVELEVSVDGREGVALGVMSQGELNALALSLFLPRMMLSESPFRFLVIDDPVQSMDSHKVDGLARVLQDVAKTRQVIVFTHDTRLLEAVRRLQIDATALEVQRRAQSVVEIEPRLDPVERHLKDALTIAHNEHAIGPKIASRTVASFCRLAIEAACIEAIRRRQLSRGRPHIEVEEAIEGARGVHALAALALHDAAERDVFSYLNNKLGRWAGDTFRAVKEGAHEAFDGSPEDLVKNSRAIAKVLRPSA